MLYPDYMNLNREIPKYAHHFKLHKFIWETLGFFKIHSHRPVLTSNVTSVLSKTGSITCSIGRITNTTKTKESEVT